jgi:hypothetical protein
LLDYEVFGIKVSTGDIEDEEGIEDEDLTERAVA